SSIRRHTRFSRDWSSDVCSSDLCAVPVTVTVNVNDPTVPLFSPVSGICSGEPLSPLPTVSNNGVTGSWSPALNNQATTTYTFTRSEVRRVGKERRSKCSLLDVYK